MGDHWKVFGTTIHNNLFMSSFSQKVLITQKLNIYHTVRRSYANKFLLVKAKRSHWSILSQLLRFEWLFNSIIQRKPHYTYNTTFLSYTTKIFCIVKKSKNGHNFWLRAPRRLLRSFIEVIIFWCFRGWYFIFWISLFQKSQISMMVAQKKLNLNFYLLK